MKTANYFPLLANHYASTKSLSIRRKHGLVGYAIYLILFQKLAATKTRSIKLAEIEELAFDLHLEQQQDQLKEVIHTYFIVEGEEFYSQELNDSLAWYDEKYNKLSQGGKKAAENMTPEQRKERSRLANEEKNKKRNLPDPNLPPNADTSNQIGDSKETDLTSIGQLPNNRNKNIEKEIDRTEKIRIKEEKEEEKKSESDFFYALDEVQSSIELYLSKPSKFFFGENQHVVANVYTDYFKQYPNLVLPISKFEEILYFQLLQITMSMDVNDLNNYLSTHPITVQSSDVHNIVKMIRENDNVQIAFENIIKEVNSTNP
jgi:uncharacterized protein YdaU (DUF1376 family)